MFRYYNKLTLFFGILLQYRNDLHVLFTTGLQKIDLKLIYGYFRLECRLNNFHVFFCQPLLCISQTGSGERRSVCLTAPAMPRRVTIKYVSLRSSLVNLPIGMYGPLVESRVVCYYKVIALMANL